MTRANSAKEDTPSPREYRCLVRSARDKVENDRYDSADFRLECSFILRVMGELGLRAGEVVHMREDWIDFDQSEIRVPSYDECTKGEDGGPCGYCKKNAKQIAEWDDDLTYETALRDMWKPKNDSAVRTIWFGWNDGLTEVLDEYLYKNGQYPRSRASVNRRIDTIAEYCEMVNKNDIYPHALRGFAARSLAKKGMRAYHLKEFMGWSEIDAAMDYVKIAANDVKSELKRVHGDSFRSH